MNTTEQREQDGKTHVMMHDGLARPTLDECDETCKKPCLVATFVARGMADDLEAGIYLAAVDRIVHFIAGDIVAIEHAPRFELHRSAA